MNCIDLRQQYGRRFVTGLDEAANGHSYDPWFSTLEGLHGHVYPIDAASLGAATNGPGPIVDALRRIPGVVLEQLGDDGANALFPAEVLDQVAEVLKLRPASKS